MTHLSKKKRKSKYIIKGFTMVELLIVVGFISVMATAIVGSNVIGSLSHSRDSRRKQDLKKMAEVLENYYNDHLRYPLTDNGKINSINWGGSFAPYLNTLPKDPQSPKQDYYYFTENSSGSNFYAIFTKLENANDPDIAAVGCSEGCGPDNHDYNYVVYSPNIVLIAGIPQVPQGAGDQEPIGPVQPTNTPIPVQPSNTPTPVKPSNTPALPPGGNTPTDTPIPNRPTTTPSPTPIQLSACGHDTECDGWCGTTVDPPGVYCKEQRCCLIAKAQDAQNPFEGADHGNNQEDEWRCIDIDDKCPETK